MTRLPGAGAGRLGIQVAGRGSFSETLRCPGRELVSCRTKRLRVRDVCPELPARALHDAVLQQNRIPIEMVRAALTSQPLRRDFTPSWKFYGP